MGCRVLFLAILSLLAAHGNAANAPDARSACPSCYTHTITSIRRCPRPICDIVCPFDVAAAAATSAAVTSTLPGANPACPATATVTVKGVCNEYRGCSCERQYAPAPPATVYVTAAPLRCDRDAAPAPPPSPPPRPSTTPRPTATTPGACAAYTTIRDGRVCPQIYCERDAAACLPGQVLEADITPAAARPIETETITRGCTVVEISGSRCQRCPRCFPAPTA